MILSMSLAEMSSGPHCHPFLFMAFQNICWLGYTQFCPVVGLGIDDFCLSVGRGNGRSGDGC